MNFYAFPWSCYCESYNTDGWFLPGTQEIVFQVKNTFSIGEDTLMIKPSFKLGILNKFIKFDDVENEPDNTEEIER